MWTDEPPDSGVVAIERWSRAVPTGYRGFDGVWWPDVEGVARPAVGILGEDAVGGARAYLVAARLAGADVVYVRAVDSSSPAPAGCSLLGYDVGACAVGELQYSIYSLIAHAIWRHPALTRFVGRLNDAGLFESPEVASECSAAYAALPPDTLEDLTRRHVRVFAVYDTTGDAPSCEE